MICDSCDREIPDSGMVCRYCNAPEPLQRSGERPPSARELALTARRMKGLVFLSLIFGILVAPFAVYIATSALHRSAGISSADPAVVRQLVVLRRVAVGLLLFWAVVAGHWAALIYRGAAVGGA